MNDANYTFFLLQMIIPAAVGVAVAWTGQKLPRQTAWFSFVFLVAQVILFYCAGYDSKESLQTFMILLGGFAFCLKNEAKARWYGVLAWFLFGLFLFLWAFAKYDGAFESENRFVASSDILLGLRTYFAYFPMVGISFFGFKLIHFAIDYRQKAIREFALGEFLSWLFFFPSIVAGPMQRFQDWQSQRENSRLSIAHLAEGVRRIIIGLFMKMVIADSMHQSTIATMSLGAIATDPLREIFLAAMIYTVYLYFDFAGYSSIAIGLGHFFGIRLPENFNQPYRARNLAEFWNRWHITLSEMLRDYLYYPMSLRLKRLAFFRRHALLGAAIPPLITFFIAGLWHGATIGFVVFGLLHGFGLAFLAVMGRRKRGGSKMALWWRNSTTAYLAAVTLNFLYVSFTFVFFCLSNDKLALLRERFFHA